jgi:hypothetical protein
MFVTNPGKRNCQKLVVLYKFYKDIIVLDRVFGTSWSGRLSLGRLVIGRSELWDVLKEWDVPRAGPLVMRRFGSGTFQELDLLYVHHVTM